MIPPSRKLEYEKIKTDDFVTGEIKEIKYDLERKSTWKGVEKVGPACRIIFSVDGYQYPHGTGWMSFNLSEKSNLFKKYVLALVEGAEEYMEFDLDQLIGMKVKMMWSDKGDFQHIEVIRPVGSKIIPVFNKEEKKTESEEDVPF
jgi:hypothetical protein